MMSRLWDDFMTFNMQRLDYDIMSQPMSGSGYSMSRL